MGWGEPHRRAEQCGFCDDGVLVIAEGHDGPVGSPVEMLCPYCDGRGRMAGEP